MTTNGAGTREPAPKIDSSLDGWVIQLVGAGALIGKIHLQTEEDLRAEMASNPTRTPVVTLFPVYVRFCPTCFLQQSPGKIVAKPFPYLDTPERAFFKRGKKQPLYVALTAFSFLSEKPEDERRALIKEIEDFEQALRVEDVGIVTSAGA